MWLVAACLGMSMATAPAPARADDAPDEEAAKKAEARSRLDAGNRLLREKQYEGALTEYEAAYRAFPSPKIRLNIAEAHFQLGNWAQAYRNYGAFLEETPAGSELHSAANARKEELEAKIAFLRLESPMEGVSVRVDGQSEGETPIEPVPVNPGRHAVIAEKDGYQRFEAAEILTTGEEKTVVLALVPIQVTPTIVAETKPPPSDDSTVFEKWWFWAIVGGVVVVGAGVAIAATTGGSDFLPSGELGSSATSTWERF